MASYKCPCCGAPAKVPVPREEIVGRLECNSDVFARVVKRLAWRPGNIVSVSELADALYGDRADGGRENVSAAIRSAVHLYRGDLQKLGWDIEALRARGYRLITLDHSVRKAAASF